jgi:RNA polymerase sigma-70 factor (ECF subfamily)
MNEAEAWTRIRDGDADSFGTVYDLHRHRVYGHALRLMRTTHDAEDVTALVFLEAWRRRSSVRVVDGSAIGWLLVATNHVVQNATRTARRYRAAMAELPPPEHEPDPAEAVLARLGGEGATVRLREAFARLGAADRDVLTLCVVQELPLAAAAETLGVPVGTVKSRLSRAKRRLAGLAGSPFADDTAVPALGDPQ